MRDRPRTNAGPPAESFDVVVVGGGISGLTAAYKLKHRKVLVLEKDALPGGAARRKEWNGVKYTLGATNIRPGYEIELDGRKFDFLTEYFDELSVNWQTIPEPTDSLLVDGTFVHDMFGDGVDKLPYSNDEKQKFRDAWSYVKNKIQSPDSPTIPVEANSARTLELDRESFGNIMGRFGARVLGLVDLMCRSIFGEDSGQVSAFAALSYLKGEFSDQVGAPGGTAQLSEKLVSILRDCIRTTCIVAGIEQDGSSVHVTYLDEKFQPVTVRGKAMVYAASKHVAPSIFRDLPAEKTSAILRMKFDAYFVANVFCDDIVYDDSFALYADKMVFTDVVDNNWLSGTHTAGRQVLSLFSPRGLTGRSELLSNPSDYWVPIIVRDLEKCVPGSSESINSIEICRYGHHFAIPYPRFITGDREVIKKPSGRYFFAKDDTQGVPCLESAIWSGMEAAAEVEAKLPS